MLYTLEILKPASYGKPKGWKPVVERVKRVPLDEELLKRFSCSLTPQDVKRLHEKKVIQFQHNRTTIRVKAHEEHRQQQR